MVGRSTVLLGAILLILLAPPFLQTIPFAESALVVGVSVAFLAAIRTAASGLLFWVAVSATASGWALDATGVTRSSEAVTAFRFVLDVVLLVMVTFVLSRDTLRRTHITVEQVSGALSVYLLLGIIWGHLFVVLVALQPGALSFGAVEPAADGLVGACVYFSFVTLTTLGYGEIAPVTAQARSLALSEAVVGQLYLAALVARIVGIQVSTMGRGARSTAPGELG